MLIENCVKFDMYSGDHADNFRKLMDSMALRLKYRHFFDPPLVGLFQIV